MSTERDDLYLVYDLEELKFNGLSLGYIADESFNWNGKKAEVTPINAAQVKGYPVKNLPKSNATVAPTFDLIQFNYEYENMAKIMGGTVVKDNNKAVGWDAPSASVMCTSVVEIFADSGQVTVIPSALVMGSIDGGLTMTATSTLPCEISIQQPANGGTPFRVLDIDQYIKEYPQGAYAKITGAAAPASGSSSK